MSLYTPPLTPQAHEADHSCTKDGSLDTESTMRCFPTSGLVRQCVSHEILSTHNEDAFFVADLGEVKRLHRQWVKCLPQVIPHYAVKCNPNTRIISLLACLGTNFDCASIKEMSQVLSSNISPNRILFANPIKTAQALQVAALNGVTKMTFDNADELRKIARFHPDAQLYLRIVADDPTATISLTSKFGASPSSTAPLLALANQLHLAVVGVAFHVGTGATDPGAYIRAIDDAKRVIVEAGSYGHQIQTLDLGGGFSKSSFPNVARAIRLYLTQDTFFSSRDIQVIAEPGRYFVASAFSLACNVIGRRTRQLGEEGLDMLYLNDGVFGSFLNILVEDLKPQPYLLKHPNRSKGKQITHRYSIWGPTCDSTDRLREDCSFDEEVTVGDWLYFEDMGAYTSSNSTCFNGLPPTDRVVYVDSDRGEDVKHENWDGAR